MKITGVVVAAAAMVMMSSTMVLVCDGEDQANNLRGSGVTNSNHYQGTSETGSN